MGFGDTGEPGCARRSEKTERSLNWYCTCLIMYSQCRCYYIQDLSKNYLSSIGAYALGEMLQTNSRLLHLNISSMFFSCHSTILEELEATLLLIINCYHFADNNFEDRDADNLARGIEVNPLCDI